MSEEIKDKTAAFSPSNPFWGLDLGERWGKEIGKLETKLEVLDQKTDNIGRSVRTLQDDVAAVKSDLRLLFERTKLLQNHLWLIGGATLAAVLAGLVLQILK
ncbi:hypothetical protein FACS189460_5250 [Deltaproteobacteria bacterium]|nr:hypothetical protein FACS189460_5250 [Deltaproteobacteria bacterium]